MSTPRIVVLLALTAPLAGVGGVAAWKRYKEQARQAAEEPEPSGFAGPRWELTAVEWSDGSQQRTLRIEGVEVRRKENVVTVYGPWVSLGPEGQVSQAIPKPRRGPEADPEPGPETGGPEPPAFSHKRHVGELGLDCRYCHEPAAAQSKNVAVSTCLNCHQRVGSSPPTIRDRFGPPAEQKRSFLVKLDETASPNRIDLTECNEQGTVVPNGERLIGIYKEESGGLVIAVTRPVDEPDGLNFAPRPTEFVPTRHELVDWQDGRPRFRNAVFVLRLKMK